MNAIPLLVVQSKSAAAVEINGTFIGEIGEDNNAVSLPVSHTGSVYVSILPLGGAHSSQRFSVTRKLAFSGGELALPERMDGMKVTRWPGGVFALELEPGVLEERPPYSFPFTVAALDWLRGARATLFYENGLHLLVEDADEKLLLGRTIAAGARTGALFARTSPSGEELLFVHVKEPEGERLLCVREAKGRFDVIFEHEAEGFSVAEDGSVKCHKRLDTHLKHERRSTYALNGGEFVLVASEPAKRVRKPAAREETVIAFIEAVQNRFENEALCYLSDELSRSVDFGDISEFLGDFECWARPLYGTPVEENCVFMGICHKVSENVYDARMFKFEFDECSPPRIDNFKEL